MLRILQLVIVVNEVVWWEPEKWKEGSIACDFTYGGDLSVNRRKVRQQEGS